MFDNLTINIPSEFKITFDFNWNPKIDVTVRRPLQTPGPIYLKQIGEEMANQIRVQVNSSADPDTVTREVTVDRKDGSAPEVLTYDIGSPSSFLVPEGSSVTVSVQDTDNAGNKSPVTSGDFTVADTFPPSAPGEVSLVAIAEE